MSKARDGSQKKGEEPNFWELNFYGFSTITNYMVGNVVAVLALPILNMSLGVNPVWVGFALSVRAALDAFTDPIMGYISDKTRTRWGRRRPFVLVGGVLTGVFAIVTWFLPRGLSDLHLIFWFGTGMVLMALAQTVFSVPYFALGIEMSPSYHGRTRVAVYRSIYEKVSSLVTPWFYPFCLLAVFTDVVQGVRVLFVLVATVSISGAIGTFLNAKERTGARAQVKSGFFASVGKTLKNKHFMKITVIYMILLFSFGLLGTLGMYLTNYYVFQGDLSSGSTFFGLNSNLGVVLGFLALPFILSISKRIQKHNTLKIALWLMIVGSLLHYVCLVPGKPYLMLVIPFFYTFGIVCIFTILPSLQADIVDVDELETGERREGMFGAAASLLMKGAGAVATAFSGILIAATGFDAELGGNQSPGTFHALLLIYSFGQAALIATALVLLHKYPLTEERMNEIRATLEERRGLFSEQSQEDEIDETAPLGDAVSAKAAT